MEQAQDRLEVLARIEEYERNGWFDRDVESDPPTRTLMPGEVDYLQKKWTTRVKSKFAYKLAAKFLNKILKEKSLVIKDIIGLEHLKNLKTGAILTCNHFNAFDSFACQVVYMKSEQKKRKMYKVIREGNYTNFPGFYGKLFRNCNTLPLSSNREVMLEFSKAVDTHLKNGHFVLVYPEQSMWWNYRKPKPVKPTAFKFAIRNNVPVVPMFITMEESDRYGDDGFKILEYTIHIHEPLFADNSLERPDQIQKMMNENFEFWKQTYESFYGQKLEYLCDKK